MRKFILIGYPLSHSFSEAYFRNKFLNEGLAECSYKAIAIDSINKFPGLLADDPAIEGINVTIPYKKEVIAFLQSTTGSVDKIGACNCIKIKNGNLAGYNTDVAGFEISLKPGLTSKHSNALILGTGGSAAAVEFVLEKLGIDYLYVSRKSNHSAKSITYGQLTKEVMRANKLIVNTTPLGMFPAIDNCPDIPYDFLTPDHYLFDLVYNPAETLFLKRGIEKGAQVKNGGEMLIIQAEESWKIWNEG